MRKFQITVNGQTYEVEVEEISGGAPAAYAAPAPVVSAAPKAAPVAAPAAAPAEAPAAKSAAPAGAPPAGSTMVSSPMPGTIVSISVSAGQAVKKGQTLLILEAMKMENEILAPVDGVVASIMTSKGASVSSGDALVALK